jgi:hypothetical protein
MRAICFKYVLFPLPLIPVMTVKFCSAEEYVSFGMKSTPVALTPVELTSMAYLPFLIAIAPPPPTDASPRFDDCP